MADAGRYAPYNVFMVPDLLLAARRNWLLNGLTDEALGRLAADLHPRALHLRDLLVQRGEVIREVIFPVSAVLSTIASGTTDDGIEVATIGNEGMAGIPIFLGLSRTETLETFAQISGEALCMRADDFRKQLDLEPGLRAVMGRYVQAFLTQISQASACNRLHPADERCARWLLMSHDRVGRDDFELTQQFIAQMLGLRRATVSEVAGRLQSDGLIRYSRGVVHILDRPALEERSCECYGIIRTEYERLLKRQGELPASGI